MNHYINIIVDNVTSSVYSSTKEIKSYTDMKFAVCKLLNIIILTLGITCSTYFISCSLSILSLFMTAFSIYSIYAYCKKIYIFIHSAPLVAEKEFNQVINYLSKQICKCTMNAYAFIKSR